MRNLDKSASVIWLPSEPAPPGSIAGIDTYKHFDNLAEAVRFVMESIPRDLREGAWIKPGDGGDLYSAEIKKLYSVLPPEVDR